MYCSCFVSPKEQESRKEEVRPPTPQEEPESDTPAAETHQYMPEVKDTPDLQPEVNLAFTSSFQVFEGGVTSAFKFRGRSYTRSLQTCPPAPTTSSNRQTLLCRRGLQMRRKRRVAESTMNSVNQLLPSQKVRLRSKLCLKLYSFTAFLT